MADVQITGVHGRCTTVMKDLGDGTFAPVVYVANPGSGGSGGGGDASAANQLAQAVLLGAVNEAAPATDTASAGLNGRLQRIAQRLSSIITALFSSTATADAARVPVALLDGASVSGTSTTQAVLFSVDMLGSMSISVETTAIGSATITYEVSDSQATWWPALGNGVGNAVQLSSSSTTGLMVFPRTARYFRARVSAYTSGTTTVVGTLSARPMQLAPAPALSAGTALIGDVGMQVRAGTIANVSIAKVRSAASTNATSVKASAGRILRGVLTNTTASIKYVAFFNKATAPSPGADTPVFTLAIPPTTALLMGGDDFGMPFTTGIAYAITAANADLDATAVAAGDVVGHFTYA